MRHRNGLRLVPGVLWSLATVAVLMLILAAVGAMTRFELVFGPVVVRSQDGMTQPLPRVGEQGFLPFRGDGQALPAAVADAPRNLILVVGDGMGVSMASATSALIHGPDGGFSFERAPVTGYVKTHAANDLVTDSAASATAMASGFKTNKKMISTLPDGRTVKTLFEAAREAGLATGVVTTSGLMDATPSAFTAHDLHRDHYEAILTDQLLSGTDVMIGASWGLLDELDDNPDLAEALTSAEARGVMLVRDETQLAAAQAPFVALFPPRERSPDAGGPALEVSVRKALEQLASDDGGFVLVVESEETDELGHDNNAQRVVEATKELDEAIKRILDFAEQRGDTLVLVTADHDTGAMSIVKGRVGDGHAKIRWASDTHTGAWVPLFAFGPGARHFGGVLDNTEIALRSASLLGLEDFPKIENRTSS